MDNSYSASRSDSTDLGPAPPFRSTRWDAAFRYYDRASLVLRCARKEETSANERSHFLAIAVHACQSLKESLYQAVDSENGDPSLHVTIKGVPHLEIVENVRNMDLHGQPLPSCESDTRVTLVASKPGKPIRISSSQGVKVSLRLDGARPSVHRSPKNIKHGQVSFGGSTVYVECVDGRILAYDFSKSKPIDLQVAIDEFLQACSEILGRVSCGPPGIDAQQALPPAVG